MEDIWFAASPVSLSLVFPGLSVHQTRLAAAFLPGIIKTNQTGHCFIRKLQQIPPSVVRKRLPDRLVRPHWFDWDSTICWIRWKLFPWKLKACSNRTLSSTVHSSGNGVKFGRSARDLLILCLCQKSIPRAWRQRWASERHAAPQMLSFSEHHLTQRLAGTRSVWQAEWTATSPEPWGGEVWTTSAEGHNCYHSPVSEGLTALKTLSWMLCKNNRNTNKCYS